MKTNKKMIVDTESILEQVSKVTDKLYSRVERIDFEKLTLDGTDLNDLKLHVGYTRNYADLAKVRLQYMRYGKD